MTVVYHGVPDPFGELPGGAARAPRAHGRRRRPAATSSARGCGPSSRRRRTCPTCRSCWPGAGTTTAADELRGEAPANVTLTGWVEQDVLNDAHAARRRLRAGLGHEGFGMSVAEAMLAGCIPVTTRAGALPEVVGDAGVLVDDAGPGGTWPGRSSRRSRMDEGARLRGAPARARALPLEVRRRGSAHRSSRRRSGEVVSAAIVNLFSDTQTQPTDGDARRRWRTPRSGDEQRLDGPDRERASGARGRAARQGGGALPALRARCATRSPSGCTCAPAATR